MKKRKFAALLAGVLCAACLLAGTITAAAQEPSGGGTQFFVPTAEYDGSLDPGNINFDTGYCCVPAVQGDGGWYALTGSSMDALTEMTDSSGGVGNTYDGNGHGFWWRQDYGVWDGTLLVSKWQAEAAGTVAFSGKVTFEFPANTVLTVYYQTDGEDLQTIYEEDAFSAGTTEVMIADEEAKTVARGDAYYFVLRQTADAAELNEAGKASGKIFIKASVTVADPNAFLLDPTVYEGTLTKENATHENGYRCVPDAAAEEQGANNWYALYGKADGDYKKMTVGESGGNKYWKGEAEYNTIWWGQDFGPDGNSDAIAMWRAPFNGTVKFSGVIYKDSMDGSDGVVIRAFNRKDSGTESVRLINLTKSDPFVLFVNETELQVVSGEMYFFCVGQGATSSNDSTKMFIKADFTVDENDPGEPADDNIGPDKEDPAASIFNRTPSYTLGAQDEYYGAPVKQGDNNTWVLYGKADGLFYEMKSEDDSGNTWKGNSQYNGISWRQEFSPDGGDDAIIAWRAPFNGKVRFTGKIFKDFSNPVGSDGVIVKAYNRKTLTSAVTEIYNKLFEETFEIYFNGVELDVVSGEMYFFSIDQNDASAFDTTKVWFKAEFTKNEQDPGQEASGDIGCARPVDYTSYFGTEQGVNNWYYAMGTIERYALMEYGVSKNSGALQWNGLSDWQGISAGNMTPGMVFANLRIYVCDRDGVISVEGKINKTGDGGDGMNVRIYHNTDVLFEKAFGSAAGSVVLPQTMKNIAVKQGDLIVYYADCGANGQNSYDNVCFATQIFWESAEGEALTDTAQFIKPVSKLELQGINVPPAILDENEDYTDEAPKGPDTGLIIGLSVGGGAIVLAAVAVIVVVILRKRRNAK